MGKIEQLKSTFVDQQDVVGGSTFIPIGSIIAIHPLTINLPDSMYWKECTGSGFLGDNFTGGGAINVPDLTNSVFLNGTGGVVVAMGGANTMYDHKHSHNSTDLSAGGHTLATSNISLASGSAGGQNGGEHNHVATDAGSYKYVAEVYAGSGSTIVRALYSSGTLAITTTDEHTHLASAVSGTTNIGHSHPASTVTGSIGGSGTEADVSGNTIENRPKYFSVKYYIRTV